LHELYPACPELFVHTGGTITDLHKVADLTKAQGMGVVMSLNRGGQRERLKVLAREHLRLTGTLEHVLFDANRYSGAGRRSGAAPLDARWIEAQRRAGTRMALTDSPYLPSGDRAALRSTLGQARGFGDDVLVALPVHLDWLTRDADVLATAINEAGIPVALMLEHAKDPLGLQSAVLGLVKVLSRATVSVSLLRSDVSVVGAIAWGASMGAVGTGSSLRHFTPVKKSDGGPPRIPSISAFVPSSMAYRTLQNINLAIAADPDHPERWVCRCDVCAGAALDVIHSNVQAYQHSLAAIAQLADHALAGLWDFERTVAWTSACRHAHTVNEEVNADTGMKWQPPDYLGAWLKAAETADIRLTI
jgi:hypothetical protein